jgi:CubicO group peptidase (beta-lactamase class C family)
MVRMSMMVLGLMILAQAAMAAPLDAKWTGQIDAIIQGAVDKGQIPGAVLLIGKGDEDVYVKAYGWRAIKPEKAPMKVDTIFDLASLTKCVACAPSIMLLAERGKIDVKAPVAKYIPAFAANGKEGITVEMLLLHHSGLIPDNPISDYADGPEKAMERIYSLPAKKPGETFVYSDVNYIVLGELVRVVDGRSLDRFAREEVFGPLGMMTTSYNPPEEWKARCAPTEMRGGKWIMGEVHDPRSFALGGVAGHAGAFSTAKDLSKFCRMFCGGKSILKPNTVAEMTRSRCLPDGKGCRGYGFDVDTPYSGARGDRFERGTTFGHTGFTGTSLWIDPKSKCFVILLSNRNHPNGKGNEILSIRRKVATLAAQGLLGE